MESKSNIKRELILDKAKQVFIRIGFNRVTMKDIIEECGISRGGIYLYFSSVDEIFVEVVKRHNHTKIEEIKGKIEKSTDFHELIEGFFSEQKERLLNMDQSLFAAMIEFCFRHKTQSDRDFYTEQFTNNKNIVLELLRFGISSNSIHTKNIDCLANSIMYILEGLRSKAVSSGVSEELAEEQLDICKRMICSELFN